MKHLKNTPLKIK